MKAGHVLRNLKASDGREVILRSVEWSDVDDLLELVNSLVEEGADFPVEKKKTRVEETKWIAGQLVAIESDRKVAIVAEIDGKTIGHVIVEPQPRRSSHVGSLVIMVRDGYRDIGVGTGLLEEAERQSKMLGLKILELEVYATNKRAQHVYKKKGYNQVGYLSNAIFKNENYVDSIVMAKVL